jgi:hypothetical protein
VLATNLDAEGRVDAGRPTMAFRFEVKRAFLLVLLLSNAACVWRRTDKIGSPGWAITTKERALVLPPGPFVAGALEFSVRNAQLQVQRSVLGVTECSLSMTLFVRNLGSVPLGPVEGDWRPEVIDARGGRTGVSGSAPQLAPGASERSSVYAVLEPHECPPKHLRIGPHLIPLQ